MKIHKTRNGKLIPISELEDGHLLNIIRFYQRKAKEGLLVCYRSPSLHDSFNDHFFNIVVNPATKDHWKDPSEVDYVEKGCNNSCSLSKFKE